MTITRQEIQELQKTKTHVVRMRATRETTITREIKGVVHVSKSNDMQSELQPAPADGKRR